MKHFLGQKDLNDRQQKWVSKLQAYDFDIVYVKGKKNIVADALSKRLHLLAVGIVIDDWRELVLEEYAKDSWASSVIEGAIQDSQYTVVNDLIIYKGRIYLVPGSAMKQKILRAFHDSPLAGHPRFFKNISAGERALHLERTQIKGASIC